MSPKNSDMEAELKALQEQVRALTAAQAARAEAAARPCEEEEKELEEEPRRVELPDFDELVASLKREIEDIHPMTCLAIFGLGVLTGRLMSS